MILLLAAIIIGSVALDQLTKWLAVVYLQGEPSFPIWQDVLHFTFVKNKGAAFGMLSEHRWVFMILSTVTIVGLSIYLFRFSKKNNKIINICLAMIIGGGIGNMIDRILLGYVIDFIDFCAFDFWVWVFNVADACVCVGVFMLAVYLVMDTVRTEREKKQKLSAEGSKEADE